MMNDFYEKGAAEFSEQTAISNQEESAVSPLGANSRWENEYNPADPVEDNTEFQMRLAGAVLAANQYELMDISESSESEEPSLPPVINVPEDTNSNGITAADRKSYQELETQYPDLFENQYIQRLPEDIDVVFKNVEDVDMDETTVINTSGERKAIGTTGLGPCIAICAYGKTKNDELLLGLSHYSGLEKPEEILEDVDDEMKDFGACDIEYYLVGGMMMPDAITLKTEAGLLALKGKFNIKGVRLHVSEGLGDETDVEGYQENKSVDVVMTTDKIYFRHNPMY
ncbi:XopAK family type III secretion system effector [Budvicia diplopodorum]|uniref:XopAK family type III secretion system effector n=1 Tax=Budvicia diplopodorum TaxID=1119056 RepID=UPI001FE41C40|nr:XopAK family type III secretion system effector [Budvicia diplopodorum]